MNRLKITKNLGLILLSIWLIINGLIVVLPVNVAGMGVILGLLAMAAGLMMLLEFKGRLLAGKPGMLLLGVWLIATGLLAVLPGRIPDVTSGLALLAILVGVLILLGR